MRLVSRALLLAAVCGLLWPHGQARAAGTAVLLAWPFEGHSGDTFYLSGSGYAPFAHLTFIVACPNFGAPSTFDYGNWQFYDGPVTNADGDFSGYPIVGFQLHHLDSSPCTVTDSYAEPQPGLTGQLFVCRHCALYSITSKALPARARFITGKVEATPQRVRAGVNEHISVIGSWGGAKAMVSIRFPHQHRRTTIGFHLNWRGEGDGHVLVDSSAARQPGTASVSVAFSLGDRRGTAVTSFTVVR